jgi:hypothetical protein
LGLCNSLRTEVFGEKFIFSLKYWIEELVLLKSFPMNGGSVMSVCFNNLHFFGQFLWPALGDRSHHQSLKS